MTLHSNILQDIQDQKIPKIFTLNDLKHTIQPDGRYLIGNSTYSCTTINTMPANLSKDAVGNRVGKHVENGSEPKYIRINRGIYRLNCIEQLLEAPTINDDEIQTIESIELKPFGEASVTGTSTISEFIAKYLATTPFQFFFKRQRTNHPLKPAVGLSARLEAYFWPDLKKGWQYTAHTLANLVTRFQAIEDNPQSADCAENLLQLFAEICHWGGVRLPKISAEALKTQVFSVLTTIDHGETPTQFFHLNSAFTKLYAIARPDNFVIFDSRVAAALTSIIDNNYLTLTKFSDWKQYQSLGFVSGRGGSRPRLLSNKWHNGYQKWSAQMAANKLCLDVQAIINKNPAAYGADRPITLRELEAILFMEGY